MIDQLPQRKERNTDLMLAAENMKAMVDELMKAGFTKQDSIELTASYYAKLMASQINKKVR
jgi:hypothetical protein